MNKRDLKYHTGSRRNPRLSKWLFRLVSGVVVAVVYFIIFSLFFDTPIEYELKKSTRHIEQEYEELEQRYDTLKHVLANVSERDRSIYAILFESEPTLLADENRQRRLDFYDRLKSMTNNELGIYLETQLDTLYRKVTDYVTTDQTQQLEVSKDVQSALYMPAIQPINNKQLTLLTASFGQSIHPFFKTMSQHNGVDYSVPVGTAVFATADGTVRNLRTKGQGSGLSITIDHRNGYETVYSHLDKVAIRPGNKVNRGDIIAFSGNSGLSFGPHLHYEVRHKGTAVDPLNYFFMELSMPRHRRLKEISQMGMQSFD